MKWFNLDNENAILDICTDVNGDIDWESISQDCLILPLDFVRKYKDKLNWHDFTLIHIRQCNSKELEYLGCDLEDFMREFQDYIDWDGINASTSRYIQFSESFIEEFILKDKLSWSYVSQYQKLSEEFIVKHKSEVNWYKISTYQKHLSEDFIRKMKDYFDFKQLSLRNTMSDEFIEEFKDALDWGSLVYNTKLSENIIEKYKDYINWNNHGWAISQEQNLSEDFMRKHQDILNWELLSLNQKMSEDFIREFQDKVNWYNISYRQVLSEDFIEEFKYRVNWNDILTYQILSDKFIRNNISSLNISRIIRNENVELSENLIRKYKEALNPVDWGYISENFKLSEDFIREFKNYLWIDDLLENNKITLSDSLIMEMKKDISVCEHLTVTNFYKLYKAFESDTFNQVINTKVGYKDLVFPLYDSKMRSNCSQRYFYHYFKDRKLSIKEIVDEFIKLGINEDIAYDDKLDLFFLRDLYSIISANLLAEKRYKNKTKIYIVCNAEVPLNAGEFIRVFTSFETAKQFRKKYEDNFNCQAIIIHRYLDDTYGFEEM